MTIPPASDPSQVRLSARVDAAAAVGACLACLGSAAAAVDWTTRPPCPDNYVRLIDVVPVLAVVCGLFAVGLAWRWWRSTRWSRWRKDVTTRTLVLSALLAVGAALPALIAVASLVQHVGQSVDGDCWTF